MRPRARINPTMSDINKYHMPHAGFFSEGIAASSQPNANTRVSNDTNVLSFDEQGRVVIFNIVYILFKMLVNSCLHRVDLWYLFTRLKLSHHVSTLPWCPLQCLHIRVSSMFVYNKFRGFGKNYSFVDKYIYLHF